MPDAEKIIAEALEAAGVERKIREHGEEGYAAFVDEDDYHLRRNG